MTASDIRELERCAREFAWSLGDVWTRRDGRPSSVTILEALQASGMTLQADSDGLASAALFTAPRVVREGYAA